MTDLEQLTRFVQKEVVDRQLVLRQHPTFRTHTQLLLDAVSRRGWEAKEVSKGLYAVRTASQTLGTLQQMITSATSSTAVSICSRKDVARLFFDLEGVPVAPGARFGGDSFEDAILYFRSSPRPLVVKPTRGAGGVGISTNVSTDKEFDLAWKRALEAQTGKKAILVEEQVPGIDIRVFIVNRECVAASTRVPAFVVGDGESTLSELVDHKVREREQSRYLKRFRITIDRSLLELQGFDMDSTPGMHEVIFLNLTANLHQGAVNLDLTDRISIPLKEIAQNAAAAIPGLVVAGVDLMVQDLDNGDDSVVLEANTAANIAIHHYPGYGISRNVADSILDVF